jgi:AraC family transcriptional regulator
MGYASAHLDEDLSLATLAARTGLSRFGVQRRFAAVAGETAKQYALRLRLERAAALLLVTREAILHVALACGFGSHEAFCRTFHRRFGMPPSVYRRRGFADAIDMDGAARHLELVSRVGPCIGIHHSTQTARETGMAAYTIDRIELRAQPVLLVRRRVPHSQIAAALGELLGRVFLHAQRSGAALAGQPFTRYLEWGPGLLTIEAGLPVAATVSGEGDVRPDTLPGGPAASTTHVGPYDGLNAAHAAVQLWIEEHGLSVAGAPWEVYVTDPAEHPDPRDWRTQIFWPLGAE